MSDVRKHLMKATRGMGAPTGDIRETMRRVRRRERNRRLSIGLFVIILLSAPTLFLWRAFESGPPPDRLAGKSSLPSAVSSLTDRVRTKVGSPGYVTAVAFGFDSLWVSGYNSPGDFVERVDPASGDVIARLEAAAVSWSSGGGGLSVNGMGVWVTGTTHNDVTDTNDAVVQRIDPASNQLGLNVDLGPGSGVDVAATDEAIWVLVRAFPEGQNTVIRVSPNDGTIEAVIPIPAEWVRRILVTPSRISVYGRPMNQDLGVEEPTLTAIDPDTNSVVATWQLDSVPAVAVSDVVWTWSATGSTGTLAALDPTNGEVVIGPTSVDTVVDDVFAGDPSGVWFASHDGDHHYVSHYDPSLDRVDKQFEESGAVIGLSATSGALWILSEDGTLTGRPDGA